VLKGKLDKSEIARRHLGTALHLFLKDQDPVSIHTLACAGAEVAEHLAAKSGAQTFANLAGEATGVAIAQFRLARSKTANALKHATTHNGQDRDDSNILREFDDEQNDDILFTGWYDLGNAVGCIPIEAQAFVAWFFARMESKKSAVIERTELEKLFPGLRTKDRKRQKEMLVRTITKLRRRNDLLADLRTDARPLILRGLPN
jgi:hypothetical protein